MKKFSFSLQTVHNLREARRDQEHQELVRRNTAAAAAAAHVQHVAEERDRHTEQYGTRLQKGAIDPIEASLSAAYLVALAHRERAARSQLAHAENAVAQQRQTLAQVAREAEATARLRDRQHARHALEAARAEQNALDEMATIASVRRLRKS